MDLYQLRAFVAVARQKHFTRAAERLHLSQPTVSGQIRALEEELGLPLFSRTRRHVELTPQGEELLPDAERLLADADRFGERARRLPRALAGRIRLGTIIDPDFLRIGELLARMREAAPLLKIDLQHGLSGWVLACVRSGALDAGFVVAHRVPPDVDSMTLRRMVYRVAAPVGWRPKIEGASWEEIARLPWIWAPEAGSYPHIVRRMFSRRHLTPNRVAEADRESTILSLATSGVGLCILREGAAEAAERSGRVVLWDRGRASVPLRFIIAAERKADAALERLRDTVLPLWRDEGD